MNLNPLDKSGFTMAVSVLWGKITDKLSSLSKVAYSGKYIDLTGRPTKLSEFENDAGFKTTDTTYGVVSKTTNGLAPKLPNETTTTKYLRQDGTWQTPPDTNTTYGAATQSAAGLMSAADKKKLDGFKGIANNDTTTEAGFAWDARRGKALREDVDKLNSALENISGGNITFSQHTAQITTDSEGKRGLAFDADRKTFILSLKGPDSILLIPFYYSGYWWVQALNIGGSHSAAANKTLSITYILATFK